MDLEELRDYATSIGIDRLGAYAAGPFPHYRRVLEERPAYRSFVYRPERDFAAAADSPAGVCTVIVILVNYFVDRDGAPGELALSNYSRFCWNSINPKAALLVNRLCSSGYAARVLDLPERASACRAGLGSVGKNCLFYADDLGSYVGIRSIGTDWAAAPALPEGKEAIPNPRCAGCGRCIAACPVGALAPDGWELHPTRCISFLNRHPEEPSRRQPEDAGKLRGRLHGCEICPARLSDERGGLPRSRRRNDARSGPVRHACPESGLGPPGPRRRTHRRHPRCRLQALCGAVDRAEY